MRKHQKEFEWDRDGEVDNLVTEKATESRKMEDMKGIRERNELLMVQQEESRRRMEEVTREIKESRDQYAELSAVVRQQSEMMENWVGGQKEKDKVIKALREEQIGNKKMIQETQNQVQLIYRWIQKQEEKDAPETPGRIRIEDSQLSIENVLTPDKEKNKRKLAQVRVRNQL